MDNKTIAAALMLSLVSNVSYAQKVKQESSSAESINQHEAASNVMLNASDDSKPREVNVGLPTGQGTPVYENGLVVSYLSSGKLYQDGSYLKTNTLTVGQSAILNGVIGASVNSVTNTGGDKFKGGANFMSNSFGLIRANMNASGAIKNGWYYAASAFMNLDPTNYRSDLTRFLDKGYQFSAALKKKYRGGEIGVIYRYQDTRSLSTKKSPYFYRKDGTVSAMPNMDISHDAYTSIYRYVWIMDPLTGQMVQKDLLKDVGSVTHDVQLFGKNQLGKGWNLDYILKFTYVNGGDLSPNYNDIISTSSLAADHRYVYAHNENDQVYTGYVQRAQGSLSPKSEKYTMQTRIDLRKKWRNNDIRIGLHGQYFKANRFNKATWSYAQEVANNPRELVEQQLVDGVWKNVSADVYGHWNYNGSLQYYNGFENKLALYVIDNWKITSHLNVEAAARIENHHFDTDWYSKAMRSAAPDKRWMSGSTERISRNFFNKNFSLGATYAIHKTWGILGDADYFERGGNISAYQGPDDPGLKQSKATYFAGGVYLNTKYVSLVSKLSQIKMTNYNINGTFNDSKGEATKMTINYDVKTLGWTTDAIIYPFSGFQLHLMLTLQNPQYDKFTFSFPSGGEGTEPETYDFKGNTLRGVSKTLLEIDPSYSWSKFKVWASARYFSKEPANYPNSVYFAARWETFAGVDYRYDKHVKFTINAVNLLNQTGAQGAVAGGNTIMDGSKYWDKPMSGTYIRPFTVEFKVNYTF